MVDEEEAEEDALGYARGQPFRTSLKSTEVTVCQELHIMCEGKKHTAQQQQNWNLSIVNNPFSWMSLSNSSARARGKKTNPSYIDSKYIAPSQTEVQGHYSL